jgi:hypothetical protein
MVLLSLSFVDLQNFNKNIVGFCGFIQLYFAAAHGPGLHQAMAR